MSSGSAASPRFSFPNPSPPFTPMSRQLLSDDYFSSSLTNSPPIGSKTPQSHLIAPRSGGNSLFLEASKSPSPSPPPGEFLTPQMGALGLMKQANKNPGQNHSTPRSSGSAEKSRVLSGSSPLNLSSTPAHYPNYLNSDPPSLSAAQLPGSASVRNSSTSQGQTLFKSNYQNSPAFQPPGPLGPRRSPRFSALQAGGTPLFSGLGQSFPQASPRIPSPVFFSPSFSSLPSPSLPSRRSPRLGLSNGFTPYENFLRSPAMMPQQLDSMAMPPSASSSSGSGSINFSAPAPFESPGGSATILDKLKLNNSAQAAGRQKRAREASNDMGKLNSMLPPSTPPLAGLYGGGLQSGHSGGLSGLSASQSPPIFSRSMKSSDSLASTGEFGALKSEVSGQFQSSGLSHVPHSSSSLSTLSSGKSASASGNGAGSSCHQCKSRRSLNQLIFCCNQLSKKSKAHSSGKPHSCRKKYCDVCISKFYGEKPPDRRQPNNWQCPACRGLCCCAACRRQKGRLESAADIAALSPASLLAYGLVYCPELVHSTLRLDEGGEGKEKEKVKNETIEEDQREDEESEDSDNSSDSSDSSANSSIAAAAAARKRQKIRISIDGPGPSKTQGKSGKKNKKTNEEAGKQ